MLILFFPYLLCLNLDRNGLQIFYFLKLLLLQDDLFHFTRCENPLLQMLNPFVIEVNADEGILEHCSDTEPYGKQVFHLVDIDRAWNGVTCTVRCLEFNDMTLSSIFGTVLYELKVLGGDKTPKDEELVDGQLVIRAKSDGYFYTALEEGLDAVLQAESRIGYIFPKQEKTFQAEIYLVGKDIANVKVGQEVQIEIPAFPASEYGTITGHIRRIAQEAEFDPQSGTTYCGAWVELEAAALTGGGNKTVPLRIGLFCQVKIITERKTVLSYIWESIR